MMLSRTIVAFLLFASASASAPAPLLAGEVLNDSWYTMQSGNTPWGYFHERIEERDGKIAYRYEMVKREQGADYEENIGAISEKDLTPFAFNLNKNSGGTIETVNASYKPSTRGGTMNVTVSGARQATYPRTLSKDAILEVFFPVWVKQNWPKLKAGQKGSIKVFTENPHDMIFGEQSALYQAKAMNAKSKCMEFLIDLHNVKSLWCVTEKGATQFIHINPDKPKDLIQVLKVSGEKEAKAFVSKS